MSSVLMAFVPSSHLNIFLNDFLNRESLNYHHLVARTVASTCEAESLIRPGDRSPVCITTRQSAVSISAFSKTAKSDSFCDGICVEQRMGTEERESEIERERARERDCSVNETAKIK